MLTILEEGTRVSAIAELALIGFLVLGAWKAFELTLARIPPIQVRGWRPLLGFPAILGLTLLFLAALTAAGRG